MRGWPFGELVPMTYDLIMADVAWEYVNWGLPSEKSPDAQYECMSLDEIKRLPVSQLARGDCVLWMWTTAPMQEVAFDVMRAWGFVYVTQVIWLKVTKNDKMRMGLGHVARSEHEPVMICKVGNPKFKPIRSTFRGLAREHSRKPDEAYEQAEKLMPSALRRLDLYSRESRAGWDAFGNETGKFDVA